MCRARFICLNVLKVRSHIKSYVAGGITHTDLYRAKNTPSIQGSQHINQLLCHMSIQTYHDMILIPNFKNYF